MLTKKTNKAIVGGVTGENQFAGRFVANGAAKLPETIRREYQRIYDGSLEGVMEFLLSAHWYVLTNRLFDRTIIEVPDYSVKSDQRAPVRLGNTVLTLGGSEIEFFDQDNCDLVMPDMLCLLTAADRTLSIYLPEHYEADSLKWKIDRKIVLEAPQVKQT